MDTGFKVVLKGPRAKQWRAETESIIEEVPSLREAAKAWRPEPSATMKTTKWALAVRNWADSRDLDALREAAAGPQFHADRTRRANTRYGPTHRPRQSPALVVRGLEGAITPTPPFPVTLRRRCAPA